MLFLSNSFSSVYFEYIDFKNTSLLRKFISVQGKILPKRITKLSSKNQRFVTFAVKRARILGILPFINKES